MKIKIEDIEYKGEDIRGSVYYLLHNKQRYAMLGLQIEGKRIILHLEVLIFGHNQWKKLKKHCQQVAEWAGKEGFSSLNAVYVTTGTKEDDKWVKFITGLGFPEPITVKHTCMEV